MSTVFVAQRLVAAHTTPMARFSARWPQPSTVVVTVAGELDAANVQEFTDYALDYASQSKKLVLDLNAVEFFSASCFAALHTLNVHCAGAGVYWAMTPGNAVSRILRVCDPDCTLPTCPTVAAALTLLHNEPRPMQLVTPSD